MKREEQGGLLTPGQLSSFVWSGGPFCTCVWLGGPSSYLPQQPDSPGSFSSTLLLFIVSPFPSCQDVLKAKESALLSQKSTFSVFCSSCLWGAEVWESVRPSVEQTHHISFTRRNTCWESSTFICVQLIVDQLSAHVRTRTAENSHAPGLGFLCYVCRQIATCNCQSLWGESFLRIPKHTEVVWGNFETCFQKEKSLSKTYILGNHSSGSC